eukprot:4996064-Amphidinium_carterae.1
MVTVVVVVFRAVVGAVVDVAVQFAVHSKVDKLKSAVLFHTSQNLRPKYRNDKNAGNGRAFTQKLTRK